MSALIISDYSHHHSHWNSQRSLSQWLTQQRVPALYGIDTRLLTKKIREKGALKAYIEFEDKRDAQDSCRGLDGKTIAGRRVKVEMAQGSRRQRGGR